jgi:glycoprotein 3-alpha-L-fucosyltransferase
MPFNSYIDVFNFSTPKSLANFLQTISSDINKYNSYFDWDNNYCSHLTNFTYFCDLCKKLNQPEVYKYYTKTQLIDWWYKSANCQQNLFSN